MSSTVQGPTPQAIPEPGDPVPEVIPAATADTPMAVLLEHRHRITVAEFDRMCETGIFGGNPRVELLEGIILEKTTKSQPHVIATDLIDSLLHRLLPSGYHVVMGNSITMKERDMELEPDAMIVRGAIRDYTHRRRTPADVALIIEVAEPSYRADRHTKYAIYAAARVPAYWIVDLNRARVEIHTDPRGEGETAHYAAARLLDPADEIVLSLDGREVGRFAAREILP